MTPSWQSNSQIAFEWNQSRIGSVEDVIIDSALPEQEGVWIGRTREERHQISTVLFMFQGSDPQQTVGDRCRLDGEVRNRRCRRLRLDCSTARPNQLRTCDSGLGLWTDDRFNLGLERTAGSLDGVMRWSPVVVTEETDSLNHVLDTLAWRWQSTTTWVSDGKGTSRVG